LKEFYCISQAPLAVLKIALSFIIGEFPHRAMVLLMLESDAACTGLSGQSARNSAVLVLV